MVIRPRLRRLLIPLALYAVAGPVSAYFLWHASNGDRGLKARAAYKAEVAELLSERQALELDKQRLERRIAQARSQAIDRDVLDGQARLTLGRVGANDIVVFYSPDDTGPEK